MRKMLMTSLALLAVVLAACADSTGPTIQTATFSQECPNCDERNVTPDEIMEIQDALDELDCNDVVGAMEDLLYAPGGSRVMVYPANPFTWGQTVFFTDGTTRVYIAEDNFWQWNQLKSTVAHEGTHAYLESTFHDAQFSFEMNTCYAQ